MTMMNLGGSARLFALSAVICTGLAGAATAASIVTNGSFESGVPGNTLGLNHNALFGNLNSTGPSWDRWKNINGWSTIGGPGIEIQSNRTLSTIDAHEGTKYVELDSNRNSAMVQSIALEVGSYMLSFWYSPRTSDPSTNGIEFNIGNALGYLTSGYATAGTPAPAKVGSWTKVWRIFNVTTAGNYDLRFAANGVSDSYGGLLDSVDVAQVPLPAAGFGLMAALGGLAALRRRRKA
ncbi:MAG: VPLPA-CTERM sorting domain-containing protein [Albidovulum sp.]